MVPVVVILLSDHADAPALAALRALGYAVLDPAAAPAEEGCQVVRGRPATVALAAAQHPGAALLALAEDPGRGPVTALLDAGAHGVALAGASPAVLAAAVEAVVAGLVVVPRAARAAVRRPVFTARQKQVLSLLVLGSSNADIASRLFLSESTVKMHLSAIFALLGVRSRKEAVDAILDPAAGLGTGILGLAASATPQEGYGTPVVE